MENISFFNKVGGYWDKDLAQGLREDKIAILLKQHTEYTRKMKELEDSASSIEETDLLLRNQEERIRYNDEGLTREKQIIKQSGIKKLRRELQYNLKKIVEDISKTERDHARVLAQLEKLTNSVSSEPLSRKNIKKSISSSEGSSSFWGSKSGSKETNMDSRVADSNDGHPASFLEKIKSNPKKSLAAGAALASLTGYGIYKLKKRSSNNKRTSKNTRKTKRKSRSTSRR